MRTFSHILWFVITGLWAGLAMLLFGIIWCLSIVGIRFGKQCFKESRVMFWSFGATVFKDFGAHRAANTVWLVLGGMAFTVCIFLVGAIWYITVAGIPLAKQCFKLSKLTFAPFGATIA